MDSGEGVLVHSMKGRSRAYVVVLAYLMKKYYWCLDKCLDFLNFKIETLPMRHTFIQQIQELEKKMKQVSNLSIGWSNPKNDEDLTLQNTHKNTVIPTATEKSSEKNQSSRENKKRVNWPEKLTISYTPSQQPNTSPSKSNILLTKQPKSILRG